VRAVSAEHGGEKIDIVDHSDDLATFVANALSPARASRRRWRRHGAA
jgi:N utilization substance protein A